MSRSVSVPKVAGYPPISPTGYAELVSSQGVPSSSRRYEDGDRVVEIGDEDLVVLPEQTSDDTDRGWGEWSATNDERLLAERPPHWDDY